jgi:prepilin-type N-terminal cleavage/methylation domain-containing protein
VPIEQIYRKAAGMDKERAFTLIELLVVISIISLLMAVLLPALSRAKVQAQQAVCIANLKSYATANAAYASTNDAKYVPFSQAAPNPDEHVGPYGYWDQRWPENREFRKCLAISKKIEDQGFNDPYIFPKGLMCRAHKVKFDEAWLEEVEQELGWKIRMSYAMNTEAWVGSSAYDLVGWYPSDGIYRGHYEYRIKRPAESIMFIESNYYQTRYERADYTKYWDVYYDELLATNWAQVAYRHRDKACMVFFDGHAGAMEKEDVYDIENPVRPYAPTRRKPMLLWDVMYPDIRAPLQ